MVGEIRDLRDGRDRHPRLAHRPPRALDAPHQRRGRRRSRASSTWASSRSSSPRRSSASLAQRLVRVLCPRVQGALRPDRRGAGAGRAHRRDLAAGREPQVNLPAAGLLRLPEHRLPGPHRHLRADAHRRRHPAAHPEVGRLRDDQARRGRPRDAHAAPGRGPQGRARASPRRPRCCASPRRTATRCRSSSTRRSTPPGRPSRGSARRTRRRPSAARSGARACSSPRWSARSRPTPRRPGT